MAGGGAAAETWIQKTIWDRILLPFHLPLALYARVLSKPVRCASMSIGKDRFVLADSSLISQKQAAVFLTSDLEILKDEKATHLICSYFIGSLKF